MKKWRVELDGVAIARFGSEKAALAEALDRTHEFGRRGHAVAIVEPDGVRAVVCDWCESGIRPRAPHERSYCTARAERSAS